MSVDGKILDGIAEALTTVRLDAIVVGNAASELHGAPVLTEDVDLLVRDTPLNRKKIQRLVELLGGVGPVDIHDLADAKRIYLPETYLDILFDKMGGGISFNAARSRSVRFRIGRHSLSVASLEDVIASKRAANRPKDRAVLPILEDTLRVLQALKGEK